MQTRSSDPLSLSRPTWISDKALSSLGFLCSSRACLKIVYLIGDWLTAMTKTEEDGVDWWKAVVGIDMERALDTSLFRVGVGRDGGPTRLIL